MFLQLFSGSLVTTQAYALQNYQVIQNYNYHPSNSSLDPITAQIIKTQDSALEIMKLIENGKAGEFLENENRTVRHYTWLGKLIDKLFRWGEYHPDFQDKATYIKNETAKRNLLEWQCTDGILIRDYINASFEVQKFLNNSCNRLNITQYWTELYQFNAPKKDIICRINICVRARLMACYSNCLPCQNATESQKNTFLNASMDMRAWYSKVDKDLIWVTYLAVKDFEENINEWVGNQINDFFNSTIKACEEEVLNPKHTNYGYLALLFVPLALGGMAFGVYQIGKNAKNQNAIEAKPLIDVSHEPSIG